MRFNGLQALKTSGRAVRLPFRLLPPPAAVPLAPRACLSAPHHSPPRRHWRRLQALLPLRDSRSLFFPVPSPHALGPGASQQAAAGYVRLFAALPAHDTTTRAATRIHTPNLVSLCLSHLQELLTCNWPENVSCRQRGGATGNTDGITLFPPPGGGSDGSQTPEPSPSPSDGGNSGGGGGDAPSPPPPNSGGGGGGGGGDDDGSKPPPPPSPPNSGGGGDGGGGGGGGGSRSPLPPPPSAGGGGDGGDGGNGGGGSSPPSGGTNSPPPPLRSPSPSPSPSPDPPSPPGGDSGGPTTPSPPPPRSGG